MKVKAIYDWLDRMAPFAEQADFDNAGLLVGRADQEVRHVLIALDVTDAVLDEAEACGAQLIITHHPLMFGGRKNMTENDLEGRLLCRMIRQHMSLIAAHTNLDKAQGGINDVLAACCGLTGICGEGYLRVGNLPKGETIKTLKDRLTDELHTTVRVMGQIPDGQELRRMGVSSGAGSESWQEAYAMGADVFLSG